MKVYVYWNLHKQCYSVRDESTGRVAYHASAVALENAVWTVGPKGNARVRRERRKNVHAGVRGFLRGYQPLDDGPYIQLPGPKQRCKSPWQMSEVTYNPYKHETFVERETGAAVFASGVALLSEYKNKPHCVAIWHSK